MAQLVRAYGKRSEDPSSNPGWISIPFHHVKEKVQNLIVVHNQPQVRTWLPWLQKSSSLQLRPAPGDENVCESPCMKNHHYSFE